MTRCAASQCAYARSSASRSAFRDAFWPPAAPSRRRGCRKDVAAQHGTLPTAASVFTVFLPRVATHQLLVREPGDARPCGEEQAHLHRHKRALEEARVPERFEGFHGRHRRWARLQGQGQPRCLCRGGRLGGNNHRHRQCVLAGLLGAHGRAAKRRTRGHPSQRPATAGHPASRCHCAPRRRCLPGRRGPRDGMGGRAAAPRTCVCERRAVSRRVLHPQRSGDLLDPRRRRPPPQQPQHGLGLAALALLRLLRATSQLLLHRELQPGERLVERLVRVTRQTDDGDPTLPVRELHRQGRAGARAPADRAISVRVPRRPSVCGRRVASASSCSSSSLSFATKAARSTRRSAGSLHVASKAASVPAGSRSPAARPVQLRAPPPPREAPRHMSIKDPGMR